MTEDREVNLERSAIKGAEARQLLDHPLIKDIIARQAENVTQALIALPVAAHEDRLALVTVLRVLRGLPDELQKMASDGAFDAKQLAGLRKHDA